MKLARTTFLFAGFALAAVACGTDAVAPPEPYVRPVRTIVVQTDDGGRAYVYTGRSRAGVESKLSFKVGGTMTKLHVKVGDVVEVGTPIAELDASDLELKVQEARAAAGQASAESRNARAEYNRARKLYETNSISRSNLDAARARSGSAGALVGAASKRVELARAQVGYAKLTSALAGSVAAVSAEVNENISPGQPIVVVASGGVPEVTLGIPEQRIAGITEGMKATVRFDAVPDRSFEARVTEVGVRADRAMGTFEVALQLLKADPAVLPGMAAEVTLARKAAAGPPVFVVPSVAVGADRSGTFVFVVDAGEAGQGKARRVPVETGELRAGGLVVKSGLTPGQTLITAGVSKVTDGQTVRIGTAAPAAPAAPASPTEETNTP